MKQIKLTQGQIALVDDEDFDFLNQFTWHAYYNRSARSFYAATNSYIDKKIRSVYMHRKILGITDCKILVDHINHDTLNNCKENLRIATYSQNNANCSSKKNGTSRYLGVHYYNNRKKWVASLNKNYKVIYLGIYDSEEDAALAYNKKAIELHGEFANLNKIIS